MHKIWWWIGAVVIVIIAWWFLANYQKPEVATTPIKIGLAVGLTGYAANWGEGEVKAIELALDKYRGQISDPVELIIEDTKSEGLDTVNATKKLIDVDKGVAIIGPTWGDSFQGGYPLAEQAHVAVISSSAALEAVENKNDFEALLNLVESYRELNYSKKRKKRTLTP